MLTRTKDPSPFITSARAVSLPIQEITRNSALGSHSPFDPPARRPPTIRASNDGLELKVARPRGSSLPSLVVNPPVPVSAAQLAIQTLVQTPEQVISMEEQMIESEPIGFAISSGSNPKRRSRSADGFYDATRGHRMSPIQWRQWRRRSDEIKYWRDSVAESPALKSKFEDDDEDDDDKEHDNASGPEEGSEDAPAPAPEAMESVPHEEHQEDQANRDAFDFGILAISMQEQESVSIEERVITMEVKLMDLEYAISNFQARPHFPGEVSIQQQQPQIQARKLSLTPETPETSLGANTTDQNNITREGSESTRPTSQSSNGSLIKQKTRPISSAPTIRPPKVVSPATSEKDMRQKRKRSSITSLTIDHYTTLINLIRREQAARRQLEDQVSDLRRQVMNLKAPSPPESRSRVPRWQGNTHHHTSSEALDHRSGRYTRDHDETDTDDGFHDVYETPIERREFEGGPFLGPFEGEAF